MSYEQTLAFLKTLNPMGIRLGLDPVRALLERLGNPQDSLPSILIAGTNGKGSVAAMVSAMLTEQGYRTGLYTSPDLIDFRERIRIDGRMIEPEEVTDAVEAIQGCAGETVSYFEFLTAMAFLHFRQRQAEIAVLEVGMGGRLDATNVVEPLVSVITNISLDHQEYLGDTLELIAREKGGIIKPGGVCLTGARQRPVLETLEGICCERGATLYRLGKDFRTTRHRDRTFSYRGPGRSYRRLACPLIGRHQISNAALALGALELIGDTRFGVGEAAVARGLRQVRWDGRLEILRQRPTLIVDGAHNPAGVSVLLRSLRDDFRYRRLILIFGVLGDKDYAVMARALFPLADRLILTRPDSERALSPDLLRPIAANHGREVEVIDDPGEALCRALAVAGEEDLVCAAGSLYLVGEIKRRHRSVEGSAAGCGRTGDGKPESRQRKPVCRD